MRTRRGHWRAIPKLQVAPQRGSTLRSEAGAMRNQPPGKARPRYGTDRFRPWLEGHDGSSELAVRSRLGAAIQVSAEWSGADRPAMA